MIILFLTGCKLDLSTDLNIGDLLRSALSKINGIASAGTIKFEVGSIANYGDDSEFFTSILEKIFWILKFFPVKKWECKPIFAALKILILFTHIDYPEKINSLIALNAGPSNKLAGFISS